MGKMANLALFCAIGVDNFLVGGSLSDLCLFDDHSIPKRILLFRFCFKLMIFNIFYLDLVILNTIARS
ncbi:hypothetical protein BZG14_05870 [Salinivibrio sp. IB282]|nr:hypothetical protein BZG14_05870 [Salinivibrio sp. IB282]